jgi:hypothetical protein
MAVAACGVGAGGVVTVGEERARVQDGKRSGGFTPLLSGVPRPLGSDEAQSFVQEAQ